MAGNCDVVVAGCITLDIIPGLDGLAEGFAGITGGSLIKAGPALLSTGGAVTNTGLALHRLGVKTRLIGKIGDDLFGGAIRQLLASCDSTLSQDLIVSPGESSSYSVVLSPPGHDRAFLHCPGTNDTFCSQDIDFGRLKGARLFHFGYPPIMRRTYADGGAEMARMMLLARQAGMTTSLDMAQPDPSSEAGKLDWKSYLKRVLPCVDLFLPSLGEMLFMLDRPRFDKLSSGGSNLISGQLLSDLSGQLIDWGAAVIALKLGDQGLFVRTTGDAHRLASMGAAAPADAANWRGRQVLAPCFKANLVGTTGSGDCTIAGFLAGLLAGLSIEETVTSAVAVGGCSVEKADATSGIPQWSAVQARIAAGWGRLPLTLPLEGWKLDKSSGVYCKAV